ncbi:hypothetical protein AB5N19_09715 [Seiridium cardinale]
MENAGDPIRTIHFPLEIWAHVLRHLANDNDFPEVWAACRRVSRAFKAAAEIAFVIEALPEVNINISLMGCVGRNHEGVSCLRFKGLSQNGQRVHYGKPGDDTIFLQAEICADRRSGHIHDDRDHGNLPLLIEWTQKVYISVCRGPASYYFWSDDYKQLLRHVWLRPNTERSMEMIVHHINHEVSFLWKPMLRLFLRDTQAWSAAKPKGFPREDSRNRVDGHALSSDRAGADERDDVVPLLE